MEQNVTTTASSNGFVTASLTLGIISLVSSLLCCWFFYLPLAISSLAILFAILSAQTGEPMHPNAKVGCVTGAIALCIVALLFIVAFAFILMEPEFFNALPSDYPSGYYDYDFFKDTYNSL